MSREIVAIVDVQVRVYGDCGHGVPQALRRETLKPGEALRVDFRATNRLCPSCTKPRGIRA